MVADLLTGEKRYEDGLLTLCLFDAVYFNSDENYVILNPGVVKAELVELNRPACLPFYSY